MRRSLAGVILALAGIVVLASCTTTSVRYSSNPIGSLAVIGIQVSETGNRWLVFNQDGAERLGPKIESDVIWFRSEIDGDQASCSYALDGETWVPFGGPFRLTFGRWRGDRLGFYCWNENADAGHVDIDWFRYSYDGPLGGLSAP